MIYYKDILFDRDKPRPAWTYRGARRNADRAGRAFPALKAARQKPGITRKQMDRYRNEAREVDG